MDERRVESGELGRRSGMPVRVQWVIAAELAVVLLLLIGGAVFHECVRDHRWWFIGGMLAGAAAVPFTVGYVWNEPWCGGKTRSFAKFVLLCLLLSCPVGESCRVVLRRHTITEALAVSAWGALVPAAALALFVLGRASKAMLGGRVASGR